jgi:hypothetical protein
LAKKYAKLKPGEMTIDEFRDRRHQAGGTLILDVREHR